MNTETFDLIPKSVCAKITRCEILDVVGFDSKNIFTLINRSAGSLQTIKAHHIPRVWKLALLCENMGGLQK